MRALLFFAVIASAGCLRSTVYKCQTDSQCGAGNVCEATGYCSFADSSCAGMGDRRYGEQSGIYASKCVGGIDVVDPDGGVDTPMGDGPMSDVPVGNCPATYMAIGGQTNRYRVIGAAANWMVQQADCDNDGATTYLAVPTDQTELTAILAAAGADAWVGVDDSAAEGTYVTANGGTLADNSPLWDTGEPDNAPEMGTGNNNSHCVMGKPGSNRLSDDKCQNTYVAVCECEP